MKAIAVLVFDALPIYESMHRNHMNCMYPNFITKIPLYNHLDLWVYSALISGKITQNPIFKLHTSKIWA